MGEGCYGQRFFVYGNASYYQQLTKRKNLCTDSTAIRKRRCSNARSYEPLPEAVPRRHIR